jgi:putative protease
MGEWAGHYGSQASRKKIYVGKIMNYYARTGIAEVKIEAHPLRTGDDMLIIGPTTGVFEDKVSEIWLDEIKVDKTVKGDLCTIPVSTFLRPSDKLYRWADSREILAQTE